VKNAAAIKAKGIDTIAVTGVNDAFVMDAWKSASAPTARSTISSPMAAPISPRRSGSPPISTREGSARARSAMPWWSTTAW
jgi:hypothetical protein